MPDMFDPLAFARGPAMKNRFMLAPLTNCQSRADGRLSVEAFVSAAERAERAGFDGVELHGAHGYLLCQFLSGETNQRDDGYGGALENRARPLFEAIKGIRQRCRADFQLGVRLSPERFGMNVTNARAVAARLMQEDQVDYLDVSLSDVFAEPADKALKGRSLMSFFTDLDRGRARLGVAGKIRRPQDARAVLDAGVDFALLGRAAILQHDFPKRAAEATFEPPSLPVTRAYLQAQFLGQAFINYMAGWPNFVSE